jgi:photosystem II stability/assembly factor-like uncharacterized protein
MTTKFGLSFLFILFLNSNVIIGQWYLQNPYPTNQDLYSVSFISQTTGWILGKNNTVLKTTDEGNSWKFLNLAPGRTLNYITFSDSTTGWIVGNGGLILKTTDRGDNWFTFSDSLYADLNKVFFTSENTGYIIGSAGTLLKTTNKGLSWFQQYSGTTTNLLSISFYQSWGYISGSDGTIIKTNDSGLNWLKLIPSIVFYSITNTSESNVWGSNGTKLMRSTNGGLTWFVNNYSDNSLFVRFFSPTDGFSASSDVISRNRNQGTKWESININGSPREMCYTGLGRYWFVGDKGLIYHSIDSAKTWKSLSGISGSSVQSINFTTPDSGWAGGSTLIRTTNGGGKWEDVPGFYDYLNHAIPSYVDMISYYVIYSLHFINSKTGWLSVQVMYVNGAHHTFIVKTTDGGLTWITQDILYDTYRTLVSFNFVSPQIGYCSGHIENESGLVYKTTNGGNNWTIIKRDTLSAFYSAFFVNKDTGWVGGWNGSNGALYKTTDGGNSWLSQWDTTLHYNYPSSIYFVTPDIGYIAGAYGLIIKTTNGGITWTIKKNDGLAGNKIQFFNTLEGVCLSYRGYLETSDGGDTWIEKKIILIPGYQMGQLWDMFFLNKETGWISDLNGSIFSSKDRISFIENGHYNSGLINQYRLLQNYPNPFNPSTNITYRLLKKSLVTIKIYNVLGKEVLTLINEVKEPGSYKINFNAGNYNLSSGIYFYRLITPDYNETKKMVLLK